MMRSFSAQAEFAALLALTLACSQPAAGQDGAKGKGRLSLADLIEQSKPSCVRLDVTLRGGNAIGSGFVVHKDGWVVTNYHVVAGAVKATASFHDGVTAEVEGYLAYGKRRDVAVLKIKTNRALKPLPLAAKEPRQGESTVAIGAPQGLSFTASEGIISAIRSGAELKAFGQDAAGTWLQTSTPISPGSSGGPLLNLKGEVVGANSGTLASGQNINFAICAADIDSIIQTAAKSKLRPLTDLAPLSSRPVRPGNSTPSTPQVACKLPAKRRFSHRFKVGKEEDEFDKLTWLRTAWLPLKHNDRRLTSCGLRVGVPFREDEVSPAVVWELGATARTFAFVGAGSRRFQILVDGESIQLSDPRHKGEIVRGGVSERMTTLFRLDGFLKIIEAKEVKARVGPLEFELTKAHLECLRDLASQLPTGVTADGEVRVERHDLKDDPTAPDAAKKEAAKKPTSKPAGNKPSASGDEKRAAAKLRLAKVFISRNRQTTAVRYLEEIIKDYPNTQAAKEARKLLGQ